MYKALIIDDEKPVIKAISALGNWSSFGIDPPYSACNGKEGLKTMRELRPEIVFIDMEMPVMNGIDFLREATKEFAATKYIVVSGYDTFEYAQVAIRNGAIDYILKPVVSEDLHQAIKKAVMQLNFENNIHMEDIIEQDDILADKVIISIKEFVDRNYCTEIKISKFSEQYFFSKEYLSKLFKKKYLFGIYEYALKLRMERAKELLQEEDLQIKDISERLGYSNNNYFSKAFKNYYSIAPSDYREKLQSSTKNTTPEA